MTGTHRLCAAALAAVAAPALLAGCGHGQTLTGTGASDPCAQPSQAAEVKAASIRDLAHQAKDLEDSGQLEPVQEHWNGPWWAAGTVTQPGPGQGKYMELRLETRSQVRLLSRIIVNNQDCFDPTAVAQAQEWLSMTQ